MSEELLEQKAATQLIVQYRKLQIFAGNIMIIYSSIVYSNMHPNSPLSPSHRLSIT